MSDVPFITFPGKLIPEGKVADWRRCWTSVSVGVALLAAKPYLELEEVQRLQIIKTLPEYGTLLVGVWADHGPGLPAGTHYAHLLAALQCVDAVCVLTDWETFLKGVSPTAFWRSPLFPASEEEVKRVMANYSKKGKR